MNNMLLKNLFKKTEVFKNKFPKHIAIIMDGNGKWAKMRGKKRFFGHYAGLKSVKRIISCALFYKLKMLTLYAFSSDNWNRPLLEIKVLMELFFYGLFNEIEYLNKYNIRLRIIGNVKMFNETLRNQICIVEKSTIKNSGLILNVAANYSGRWEILSVIRKIIRKIKKGKLSLDDITESFISSFLLIDNKIPVDLVVRTGGECRLSNFLLWQIAYSELYFTDITWPDFDRKEFEKAILSFMKRERRFGSIKSQ